MKNAPILKEEIFVELTTFWKEFNSIKIDKNIELIIIAKSIILSKNLM